MSTQKNSFLICNSKFSFLMNIIYICFHKLKGAPYLYTYEHCHMHMCQLYYIHIYIHV